MDFDGKVAIVTAAAGAGMGSAIVRALAQAGARVVVTDHHEKRLAAMLDELRSSGADAIAPRVDVTSLDDIKQMVDKTLEKYGQIDVLVNNAGTTRPARVVEMSDEMWDFVVNLNLRGTFWTCRAVLPSMIERRYGKIVNLASINAESGDIEMAHYAAAKAGVIAFSRSLAREVGEYGIQVNTVSPGHIYNDYLKHVAPEAMLERLVKNTPMGRGGEPNDIVGPVLFLASDQNTFVTGADLRVDGGLQLGVEPLWTEAGRLSSARD